jgi:hypothetical protein
MSSVPYLFGNAVGNIPLSQLDVNFANVKASADSALVANFVTGNAQANITSVGTLTGLSVAGNISYGNLNSGNFTIAQSSGKLIIQYNGTAIFSINSTGNVIAAGTITANSTP